MQSEFGEQARAVLGEIRQKLRIREDDTSVKATKAIDVALSKEIASATLKGVDTDAMLYRAGQAGRLSPRLNAVETTPQFNAVFLNLGIKKQRVFEAVQNPYEYQHLLNEGASDADRDDISIFLQRYADYWLLVQTQRKGNKQIVQSAWLVFPTDSTCLKPHSLLRS